MDSTSPSCGFTPNTHIIPGFGKASVPAAVTISTSPTSISPSKPSSIIAARTLTSVSSTTSRSNNWSPSGKPGCPKSRNPNVNSTVSSPSWNSCTLTADSSCPTVSSASRIYIPCTRTLSIPTTIDLSCWNRPTPPSVGPRKCTCPILCSWAHPNATLWFANCVNSWKKCAINPCWVRTLNS